MFSNQKEDNMKRKIVRNKKTGKTTYYYEPSSKPKNNPINNKNVFVFNKNTEEDFWETKIDEVKECSKAPSSIQINMHQIVIQKIKLLNEKFKNIEWLAYLVGKEYEVEDLYIPHQEVSSVTVDKIESPEYNKHNIIGVIHSHHSMGNTFSGTDDEYINQNHDISICVTSKMDMNAQIRWKTPCGSTKIINGHVNKYFTKDISWVDGFFKEIDEKIKEKTINLPSIYTSWNDYKRNGNFIVGSGGVLLDEDGDDDDWYYDKDDNLSDDDDILGYKDNKIKDVDEMMETMTLEEEMDLYKQMVDDNYDEDDKVRISLQ
jgi:hypothetical protein